MGHLGNPIAFRLNYNKKWADTWFIKNLYYPEFLNKMLNLRDYLYYFFTKKSMLKSGFCLSHLNIIKIQKLYIIKVFIYSIDLEKLSYDFINKIYNLYYLTLKTYTGKISGVTKIVLKEKLAKKRLISELQNSDLFAFIFIYYFFELFVKRNNKSIINNNKFLNIKNSWYFDKLLKRYISYIFFRLKFSSVRQSKKRLYLKFSKKRKLLKRFKIFEYKKKKKLIKVLRESKLAWLKHSLNKKFKNPYNKQDALMLNYFKTLKFNKKKWKINKLFVSQFKVKNAKMHYLKGRIYKTLNDKFWYRRKFNIFDLFFFILKKTKFEKFNNTLGLYYKWTKARIFFNLLKSVLKIKNKTSFYFLLQAFISLNKMGKNIKVKKNFRDGIYTSLYNLIGKYFFFRPLKIVIHYIKYILKLIYTKLNLNQIKFIFFFMSNLNVTANLISFYLAMKFKKGFNLFGATNPLKNELARLHFKNKINKNPYSLYNYKFLFLKKVKIYKKILKRTIVLLKLLFRIKCYINYNNNNSWLFYNTYMYYKIIKNYYYYKTYIRLFYICAHYNYFISFNKLDKYVIKSKAYLNNLYLNTFESFNYKANLIKYKRKIISKLINFSIFFYKNIVNYEFLKTLWLKFQHFNLRNIRQKNIEKYKSILMGFKFAFRGRFSRKQRASFIWIHEGKVPLNTLNLFIDYSFLTIVLKNSIVSIKIWLYRNIMYSAFKYILTI